MPSPALKRRLLGLALCVVVTGGGCATDADPENAEKPEDSANAGATDPESSALTTDAPGADVQTKKILRQRIESVEKQLEPRRRAVAAAPNDPDAHLALGKAATRFHVFEEGIAHLERAHELDPSVRRRLDLAIGYSLAARPDRAVEIYEDVLRVEPGNATALYELGNISLRRSDNDRAIALFTRALQAQPQHMLAQLHLADALLAGGRHRDAYRAYEKVLVLDPQTAFEARAIADALYGVASLDLMMGAHERAGQFLQELIRMVPEHDKAYYAYGQVLLHMGRPEQAQQAFDKHVTIQESKTSTSAAAMGE